MTLVLCGKSRSACLLAAGCILLATVSGLAQTKSKPAPVEDHLRRAQTFFDREEYRDAISALRAALSITPQIPGANYQLGVALWKLGNFREAEAAFREELRFDPPDAYSLYYLGRIKLDAGEIGSAIAHFDQALRAGDILDVRRRLASAYLRAGRTSEAAEFLERSIDSRPGEGELHYLLGRAYQQQGRSADAKRQFALARESKAALQGDMRWLLELRQALSSGDSGEAHRIAERLMLSREPEVLIAAGTTLGEQGLHTKALPFLEKTVELQPRLPEALYNLGRSRAMSGDSAGATMPLEKAVEMNPDFYEPHVLLGTLAIKAADNARAIRHLRRAAQIRSDNPKLLAALALQYLEGRYFQDAVAAAEKAVELDPANADLRFLLIQARYRNSDFNRALATAIETRDKFPALALSHYHVGAQLSNVGRFQEAKPELQAALSMDPELVEARVMLGDVLFKLGDAEGSLAVYRAILDRNPSMTDAHTGLGRALIQLRRYKEAAAAMQEAVRTNPEIPSLHLYLSQAYRALGDIEAAKREAAVFADLNQKRAEARDRDVERKYPAARDQ